MTRPLALSHGITDQATQQAVRQLERLVGQASSSTSSSAAGERITGGASNPASPVTWISGGGSATITLPDGNQSLDGVVKRFVVTGWSSGTGTLKPTNLADGSSHAITWTAACSFELIWDHNTKHWRVLGTPNNATVS